MKRAWMGAVVAWSLVGTIIPATPAESICWGSLYVASRSQTLLNRCPTPVLTKTWRIRCYDGCGYTNGSFSRSLSGYGECYKGKYCKKSIKCLPLAGSDVQRFNPPSLTSTMINREGYYRLPCDLPSCRTSSINTIFVDCDCDSNISPVYCAENDPIVVSLGDRQYRLTDRSGGVEFDLGDNGVMGLVPWTDPQGDEAFLALDRNHNGTIDNGRELFGDVTPQHSSPEPNGFLALGLYDDALSGGNEDGRISAEDEIFPQLRLWRDADHDGFTDPGELLSLPDVGLEWIDLEYTTSQRVDRHGNRFRFRARTGWSADQVRAIWNVYLVAD